MSNQLPTTFRNLTLTQVGILVPDLRTAVQSYGATMPLDDWLIYSYSKDNVADLTYRGAPADCSFRLAMAGGAPQIELIEPLDGPSIYHEWIAQHGYGVQHFGYHVPSLAPVVSSLAEEGWHPVQSGSGYGVDGDGGFAYFDTIDILGVMLEVIEVPAQRRPSERLT